MRFSILHGLVLMVLIALAMVYLRMHFTTRQLQAQIFTRSSEIPLLVAEERVLNMRLYAGKRQADYYETWLALEQELEKQLPRLQKNYLHIEPKAGRLIVRELPMLQRVDVRAKTWRMHVPEGEDFALFLGADLIEIESPVGDHLWSNQSLLQPSGPFSHALTAGEHVVELRKRDNYRRWTLIVDGNVLWNGDSDKPFDGMTFQGISSWPEQAEVRYDNLPLILEKANFQGATKNQLYQLNTVLWVGRTVPTFDEFPGLTSNASVRGEP